MIGPLISLRYIFGAWAKKFVTFTGNSFNSQRLGRLKFSNKKLEAFDIDDLLRASAKLLGNENLGITYKATLENGAEIGHI
ncbi:hypothetical protein Lal_00045499 [Lupinus albus]|nr:hypothetical protein Lal_00045499 [Lupinus albus]